MAVFVVSDAALIGVTRIASNYILIKSFMFCSASALVIFVGGRFKSLLIVVYLCSGACLILKSNSRI